MSDSEKVHFLTEVIYRVSAVLFYFRVCFIFALIAEEKSQNQVSSFITAEIFVRISVESAASSLLRARLFWANIIIIIMVICSFSIFINS